MDPLFKIKEANQNKLIPKSLNNTIEKKMKHITEGIKHVEKASGLKYPPYYIEPHLFVAEDQQEFSDIGVLYARTVPIEFLSKLEIWIQISAPLIAFGVKTTVRAVLAHEFLHYVELSRRFMEFDIASNERYTSLLEASYRDHESLIPPAMIFNDKNLIKLVNKKLPNGLIDEKLQNNTAKKWLDKNLPCINIATQENVVNISASMIPSFNFDPKLKSRLEEIERSSLKIA